ncbi:molybdenum cofactor sulfurase [Tritrichomonas foetus]|uniref:Molybdenum cofactor sulfurase n=1 Tax=Tritrichomonas foetus TaxID=1144522 RepID=A0A1J4K514_9EUKA|nr:molybdenum cofactor sulfurase [Tritrichomonas foetus]|eukprot:OHT05952.1 molybdenum cofactor sulfurase [Tritrichomonas foetus]
MRMVKKFLFLKRFQWIRIFIMLILTSTVVGLIFTFPADAFDPSTPYNSYPNDLQNIRSFEMKHLTKDSIYLDYTGAGVYSDFAFDQYKTELTQRYFPGHPLSSFRETSENTIDKIRDEILDFVGADPKIYSVIFLASATQALKLVGEIFPWTSQSVYAYTRYNHNSVLGIRQYAIDSNSTFKAVSWPPDINEIKSIQTSSNAQNLFAFPLEDNFAGTKPSSKFLYEITHDEEIRKKFIILGDVAAYLPTNPLNLTETPLDACSLSFYKIMGYPNTGALIIRKDFIGKVKKLWYSSLSANFSLPSENIYHLSEKFYLEDENVPLEINLAVHHGLNFLKSIGMKNIQSHVWNLTQKLYKGLNELTHSMGGKVAEIYGNHELNDADVQGGIVAFNLKKTNGGYFGYSAVVEEASEFGFHLRGGCHCNPGACFKSMKISEEKVKKYYDQKTTCGDKNDVVDGIPLGSVRASLGWASTESDVDSFIQWVQDNYVF